jgi:hypothetical protein
MGRFATAAIITLALVAAAARSHADDLAAAAPPPGAAQPEGVMGAMPRPPGQDGMGWAGRPDMSPDRRAAMWRMHRMEQSWGLFFDQRDKNLSDGDVQVLAKAILLLHGNHDWKVVDVADAADGEATFAYATAEGSVIARFEIDRHNGRITRIG